MNYESLNEAIEIATKNADKLFSLYVTVQDLEYAGMFNNEVICVDFGRNLVPLLIRLKKKFENGTLIPEHKYWGEVKKIGIKETAVVASFNEEDAFEQPYPEEEDV